MFRSMQESLSNEEDYKPLTPQSSGEDEELTNLLEDAVRDSLEQNTQHPAADFGNNSERCQNFGSRAYEDILATAVLNKVLEKCDITSQEFGEGGSLDPGGGTDTDSGLSGSIGGDALKRMGKNVCEGGASEGSSSPLCESPKESYALALASKTRASPTMSSESPDIGVGLEGGAFDNSSNIVWNFGNEGFSPLQFKIEEHIEEVTTHHLTDEESNNSYNESENDSPYDGVNQIPSKNPKQRSQPKNTFRKSRHASKVSAEEVPRVLPPFDLPSITAEDIDGLSRVPFPELGVDLLRGPSSNPDGRASEFLLENCDWKENWLFMKERSREVQTLQTAETITMLIPNPSSMINPTIGDRDIDELSELSDRHSVYSFDSSGEEDELSTKVPTVASKDLVDLVGEINAEFGQQDQEYTEDISALDRLQMNQIYSRNSVGTNSNSIPRNGEITGVTPAFNSGHRSSNKKYQPNYQISNGVAKPIVAKMEHSRNKKSTSSSKMLKTNIILTPPKDVPQLLDNTMTLSSNVWFESIPEDMVVPLGKALRLSCQVHSRHVCGVSWYFEKELLAPKDNIFIWKKGDTYNLNIFGMSEDNVGDYFVAAYTKEDCVWARCQVTCVDQGRASKIPRITLALSDVTAERGDDVIIECQVGGHPEPKVTFMRNSIPLSSSTEDCLIENDQYGTWTLMFHEVKETDAGQIKVIASNSLGHAMSFCNFKVVQEGQVKVIRKEENFNSNLNIDRNSDLIRNAKNKKNISSDLHNSRIRNNRSNIKMQNDKNTENFGNDLNSNHTSSSADYYSSPFINNLNDNYNDYSQNSSDHGSNHSITINGCMFQPPKPGTIAEREHRKWLEAKPLANNPYSPEKLVDRLGKSPHRFPSLPTVYRDTSGDECADPSLRDLLLSHSDLSRYSRDYHVNDFNSKSRAANNNDVHKRFERSEHPRKFTSLVKIESKISDNWKEELKDIKLDVGKKVADIQKTIDAYQYEWQKRLQQRGWNTNTKHNTFKRPGQKLSASCINLHTPPKIKSFVPGSRSRHLVYSSTETLNKDQSQNNLWRTVSVDTLNPPFKYSFPSTEQPSHNQRYDDSKNAIATNRDSVERRYSCPPHLSDSDDSSNLNSSFYTHNKQMEPNSYFNQNGYNNKKMTSYYSENSIESLKEESDTEDSLQLSGDNSNMPSVRDLACKFDLKGARNKSSNIKRHHEKIRSTRNKDVVIIEQNKQNKSAETTPYNVNSRKYNDKFIVNEVRIGGKPTKIYASNFNSDYPRSPYRIDGHKQRPILQDQENFRGTRVSSSLSSPSSEVFTPTENDRPQFSFDHTHYSNKYRNRFSTSETMKADEFWGNGGAFNLRKMKHLSSSNSSMAESDISAITLPNIPDSTSKDINDLFGIKLRRGVPELDNKQSYRSSSSDIFPLSKTTRPKSVHDFRNFPDLSDEESSDSMNYCDPVIARKHNLPKFYANVTTKPQKYHTLNSKSTHDINSGNELDTLSIKTFNTFSNSGAFSLDRPTGNRMYDFLRKYENKKSLEEIPTYSSQIIKQTVNNTKVRVEEEQFPSYKSELVENVKVENDKIENENQSFGIPMRPKLKKRGSMHEFLKMYSNRTTLPSISNSEELKIYEESNEKNILQDLPVFNQNYDIIDSTSISKKIKDEPVHKLNTQVDTLKNQNEIDGIDMATSRVIEDTVTLNQTEVRSALPEYPAEIQALSDFTLKVNNNEGKMIDNEISLESLKIKSEMFVTTAEKPVTHSVIHSTSKSNMNQVSTLYAPVNKPSIKPKPESLKPFLMKQKSIPSNIQLVKKNTHSLPRTLSNENVHHQQTKVSKFHTTPNSIYTQYLHNYSKLRSLNEKENYNTISSNLDSGRPNSNEKQSFIYLHKEVQTQTEPENKDLINQRKISGTSSEVKNKHNTPIVDGHKYKSTMTRNAVFSQGTNVTIKIDVQPIRGNIEYESSQTAYEIDVFTENDTDQAGTSNYDNANETTKNEDNIESFKNENKEKDELFSPSDNDTDMKENILANNEETVKSSRNAQSTIKIVHMQNKPIIDNDKTVVKEEKISKQENISPNKTKLKTSVMNSTEAKVYSKTPMQYREDTFVANSTSNETRFVRANEHIQKQSNGLTHEKRSISNNLDVNESTEVNNVNYNKRRDPKPILLDVDEDTDPQSLTKRIIKGARYSTSGLVGSASKVYKASLPENSPYIYRPRSYENLVE